MSDQNQNIDAATWSSRLLFPFHLLHHCYALLSVLITRPVVILRNAIMGFFYIQNLGYGHASSKVSSRLKSWMKIGMRKGCFVCNWIEEGNQEFGPEESTVWLNHYRPSQAMLNRFREKKWPENSPVFSLLLTGGSSSKEDLTLTLNSITSQTYVAWELLCLVESNWELEDFSGDLKPADRRIRFVRKESFQLSMARGTHIALVGRGDRLESQALHRMADAANQADSDILYSDEAILDGDTGKIDRLVFRTAFSEDGFLSCPEAYHLCVIRKKLLEHADFHKDRLLEIHSPAMLFRAIGSGRSITHIPEILYIKKKTVYSPDGMEMESLIRRHLACKNQIAHIYAKESGLWNIVHEPSQGARVAIIIPTKNQAHLLKTCLESLYRTVPQNLADVYVINHQSDEPETLELLEKLRSKGQVIEWEGIFNFSEMNNHAVSQLRKPYSHYLFLNNDTEAIEKGWLEHMVGLGCRPDVGVVGALLIYPDGRAQHAGVAVGIYGGAGHLNRLLPVLSADKKRIYEDRSKEIGFTRDVSAVTGACLLIGSSHFKAIGGFDNTLEVGFGDIDICHKVKKLGYKVLIDSDAVLYHYESLSRGTKMNPHPEDTRKYLARYADLILKGDPYFPSAYRRDNSTPVPKAGLKASEVLASDETVDLVSDCRFTDQISDVA